MGKKYIMNKVEEKNTKKRRNNITLKKISC